MHARWVPGIVINGVIRKTKWPCKWVTGNITPITGGMTPISRVTV